ncbi:TPA: hypothetical protein DCZ39_08925 [Patescibacteria group bacterium]|nr:hypothetical protein [Candidatus Gracilibacteria bacterium]
MKTLGYIIENREIEIQLVEEDYTSVQSGEITSNFKKNAAEDTVSAMLILERGLNDNKKSASEKEETATPETEENIA